MSSKVTINQSKGVRVVGLLVVIAGVVLAVAGALAFWQVSVQLRAEHITVSQDASFMAGKRVQDPLTAYAQAEAINDHALEMADNKTYAELAQDDSMRDTVMNASFLRASLFTSVVAFGLSAVVFGLGVFLLLLGWALRRISAGPAIIVETTDEGGRVPRHGGLPASEDSRPVSTPVPGVAPTAAVPGDVPVAPAAEPEPTQSTAEVTQTLRRHSLAARRAAVDSPEDQDLGGQQPETSAATPTPSEADEPGPAVQDAVRAPAATPSPTRPATGAGAWSRPTGATSAVPATGTVEDTATNGVPVPPRRTSTVRTPSAASAETAAPTDQQEFGSTGESSASGANATTGEATTADGGASTDTGPVTPQQSATGDGAVQEDRPAPTDDA